MPLMIISYDLMKKKDYPELFAALRELGATKVLYSQWAVHTQHSAAALRDHVKQFIDSDDRLLVTQVEDWAAMRALVDLNTLG